MESNERTANSYILNGLMAKEQLQMRKMTLADVSQVYDIERDVFSLPWSLSAFQYELTQNHLSSYYVLTAKGNSSVTTKGEIVQDNIIIGYVGYWSIIDEAHITTIAVKREFQRQGLGSVILKQVMIEAAANNIVNMTLEVRVSNYRAIALYKRLGFIEAGIRKKYYSDNEEDALIMWAVLNYDDK